jgi:hypothetical protein
MAANLFDRRALSLSYFFALLTGSAQIRYLPESVSRGVHDRRGQVGIGCGL